MKDANGMDELITLDAAPNQLSLLPYQHGINDAHEHIDIIWKKFTHHMARFQKLYQVLSTTGKLKGLDIQDGFRHRFEDM